MTEPQRIHIPGWCVDLIVDPALKNLTFSMLGQLHLDDPQRLDASCVKCHAPSVIQGVVYMMGANGTVRVGTVLECNTCIHFLQHQN